MTSRLPSFVCLFLLACGGSTEGNYAAALGDSDAVVAVAVGDAGAVSAYVCGGPSTIASHTRWFFGSVAEDSFELESDGWRMEGNFDGSDLTGVLIEPDGTANAWRAPAADEDALGGLFVSTVAGCRSGVVILQADAADEPHMQGVFCDALGNVGQVTPVKELRDLAAPLDLVQVQSEVDGELFPFEVKRVVPLGP